MTTYNVAWFLVGVGAALASILVTRKLGVERQTFGFALLIAAVWYVGFGVISGEGLEALWPQAMAGAFFAYCGIAGIRGSDIFISVGWLVHILWDSFSLFALNATYAPDFTLPACASFDIVVGAYFFLRSRQLLLLPREAQPESS